MTSVRNNVEKAIGEIYKCPFLVDGQKCFQYGESHFFMITGLDWEEKSVIAEHADSLYEAKHNMFEDGDRFYIDEMTEDEIVDAIIHEVES